MLKIRLKRCGRKKRPSYRIVLVPSQWRRDGKFIEELGFDNQSKLIDKLVDKLVDKLCIKNYIK